MRRKIDIFLFTLCSHKKRKCRYLINVWESSIYFRSKNYVTEDGELSVIINLKLISFMKILKIVVILTCILGASFTAQATLKVYPAPIGALLNTRFTVQVREPGGTWQNLDEYSATIGRSPVSSSFAYFDCSGSVEVSVTLNAGNISTARVRPLSKGITPIVSGNNMTFTISGPMKLSVEVNGDRYNNLHLFANPLEVNPPVASDSNVTYLGPGIYTGDYTVASGKMLYLAGGAILRGTVTLSNTIGAKLIGRGIIDHPSYQAITSDFSDQSTIDGVIVVDYGDGNSGGWGLRCGQSTNVTIRNFKAFSYRKWTDGIDLFCCKNVTIDDVFMRTGDDAIAIYNHRDTYYGNTSNITVTNSILMPDVAHPINIGTHGNTISGAEETIDSLTFRNIDILEHYETQVDYQGTMAITDGDANLISNVHFEDVRVEDFTQGQLLNVRTVYNSTYNTAPGRGVNNVYFKNISYNGTDEATSQIAGYDTTRMVRNVTFENLRVNGKLILDAPSGNLNVGRYTQNVQFMATPSLSGEPVIISSFKASATIDSVFNYSITATGTAISYNATGLPSGLSINTSTGEISGTPVVAVTSTVIISATNTYGTATATLVLKVSFPSTLKGTYTMVAQNSGKAIDVKAGSAANGASVIQSSTSDATSQQWSISQLSGNDYSILNVNSGKAMDVVSNSTANGAKIEQRTYSSTDNSQIWTITDNGDSTYKIIGKASGKSIDVTSASPTDGALMEIWPYSGGTNQRFYLSPISIKTTIDANVQTIGVVIFPNPVLDELNINMAGSKIKNVEVINRLGLKLISKNFSGEKVSINMSRLSSGIYVIEITDGHNRISRKIVKK
jgi:polygalacturonase